jgi:small subunit ribosomal protein S6
MIRQYETVFIMNPVLSEEQMLETVAKFRKFLTDHSAEMVFENNWGMRKMAYPIQKKKSGFYYLMEYKADTQLVSKLEVEFTRDERVMRFLSVQLDKDAIAYNEKKRKNAADKLAAQEAVA